jgi:LEA14-like dessication related protein
MRRSCLALPALMVLCGCQDPVHAYQEAARQLRFTLDRLEPSLELALPLERSQVRFRIRVGVENPSDRRFDLRSFHGLVFLEGGGDPVPMAHVDSDAGIDLPPRGRGSLDVDVRVGYRETRAHFEALRAVLDGRTRGTWRLDGEARVEVAGLPFTLPVETRLSPPERP